MHQHDEKLDIVAVILGGGVGSRLFPLTRDRTKPAVPLAGKYRLIDIPMSNCFHAGIDKIAILTQFNSVSLHRHIHRTYNRDIFTPVAGYKSWLRNRRIAAVTGIRARPMRFANSCSKSSRRERNMFSSLPVIISIAWIIATFVREP